MNISSQSKEEMIQDLLQCQSKLLEIYLSDFHYGNNLSLNQQSLLKEAANKIETLLQSIPKR